MLLLPQKEGRRNFWFILPKNQLTILTVTGHFTEKKLEKGHLPENEI
jgi:hypothetical protein